MVHFQHDLRGKVRHASTRARLDELIAQNPEHVTMLHRLEEVWDQAEPSDEPMVIGDIPTGDELVAELEQFLRDQRPE